MSEQKNTRDNGGRRRWRRLAAFFDAGPEGARIAGMVRSVGPIVAIALVIAGFGAAFAYHAGHLTLPRTADSAATVTASPSDSATATPADTPIAQASSTSATATTDTQATPGSAGSSSSSTSTTRALNPFQITSVKVVADPTDDFTHTCAPQVYETFTVTITAAPNSAGETVRYGWGDMSGSSETVQHRGSMTFAPGQTTSTLTFKVGYNAGLGDGSPQQDTFWVTYPEQWMWPWLSITHATVAFTCVRQLTSLTLTSSISAWDAPCGGSTPVVMTWTVAASPGPRIEAEFSSPTYSSGYGTWLYPGGFGAILPATTDPSQTTTQASGSIDTSLTSDSPNGTYWMQVATTSPTVLTAKATLTKNC